MTPPSPVVRSVVLDFDGTICAADVSDELFDRFAPPVWRELDREYERGEIGSRANLVRMTRLLRGTRDEMLEWTLERHHVDPTFPPFVSWARTRGLALAIVSDGLGFHIEPLLRAAGIEGIEIMTNMAVFDSGPVDLEFPAAHPSCITCGACKMAAVTRIRELHGPVAYVGDGHSDRFGALYADVVLAKRALADMCRSEGLAYVGWETFDDVRGALERLTPSSVPGPAAPARCPGWKESGRARAGR